MARPENVKDTKWSSLERKNHLITYGSQDTTAFCAAFETVTTKIIPVWLIFFSNAYQALLYLLLKTIDVAEEFQKIAAEHSKSLAVVA